MDDALHLRLISWVKGIIVTRGAMHPSLDNVVVAQALVQARFGQLNLSVRGGQRVVLPGPNILQLLTGNGEEHAVRVHLRGVRAQSLIALLKVLVNQDAGRSLVARRLPRGSAVRDVLNPAAQQALTVRIEQMLVQGEGCVRG